jgi:alpha-beta hydrolase superfamily lysophospholipase
MIPAVDSGISLYMRNKHPQGAKKFAGENILLFVHGSTYPAETAFDLKLSGLSWMDFIAQDGYDVYLVDLRGYGRSTRLPEMDRPAVDNAPLTECIYTCILRKCDLRGTGRRAMPIIGSAALNSPLHP